MTKAEQHTAARLPFFGLLVFSPAVLREPVLARLRVALEAEQLRLAMEEKR